MRLARSDPVTAGFFIIALCKSIALPAFALCRRVVDTDSGCKPLRMGVPLEK